MVVLFYFSQSEFLSGICGAGESGMEHILFAKGYYFEQPLHMSKFTFSRLCDKMAVVTTRSCSTK